MGPGFSLSILLANQRGAVSSLSLNSGVRAVPLLKSGRETVELGLAPENTASVIKNSIKRIDLRNRFEEDLTNETPCWMLSREHSTNIRRESHGDTKRILYKIHISITRYISFGPPRLYIKPN